MKQFVCINILVAMEKDLVGTVGKNINVMGIEFRVVYP
jgi:uncharacterized protein YcbX